LSSTEALNNVIKHSAVRRVEVQLREDSGEIHLVISDMGRGFDIEAVLQGKGLSLTSNARTGSTAKRNDRDRIEAEWWNDNSSSGAAWVGKTF
jgi:signal transduction histidine kinase